MKEIFRGILAPLLASLAVAGCSGGDKPVWQEYITLPHYIWAYYDGPLTVDFRRLCVCISEPGEFSDTKVCSAEGVGGENLDEFLRLAEANGDTDYNKPMRNLMSRHTCFARTIREVHVVSNFDYDDAHPAGTSLDDIVCIWIESFAPFIRSGYRFDYPSDEYGIVPELHRSVRMLSEPQTDIGLVMASEVFSFGFTALPEAHNRKYSFTFTFVMADGATQTVTAMGVPSTPGWLRDYLRDRS